MKRKVIRFFAFSILICSNISTVFGQNSSLADNAMEKLMEGNFIEAKSLATTAITADRNNSLAYAVRGRTLFAEDKLTAAQTDLETGRKMDSRNGIFFSFQADCFKYQQNKELSKETAGKAIQLLNTPASAISYYARGLAYVLIGKEDDALADYTKAIQLNARCAIAYLKRGLIYLDKKQNDAALTDFSKALEINDKYTVGYFCRGNAYYEQKKYDLAISEFTRVIEIDPKFVDAYFNRAIMYKKKEQYDKAIDDWAKVIEQTPNDAAVYRNRGNIYVLLKKNDQAITDYSKAIELEPKNTTSYIDRGNIYFNNQQQPDLAFADYKKVVEIEPKNAAGHNNMGAVYGGKQQFSLAIANYTKAIEVDPNYLMAYINRADAYDAIGESKLADIDRKKYSDLGGDISASGGKSRRAIFPRGTFDPALAKTALGRGMSKIVGRACTKREGLIFYAAGVKVILYPVTPYLEEWHKLRDQKEDKKTGVYMSTEANKYTIEAVSGEDGRFSFEGLMPGRYFIQLVHNFNQRKTERIYTGSDVNMQGPMRVTTNYYYDEDYVVERSQRLERFVEIEQDGKTKKITLANGLIKGCGF